MLVPDSPDVAVENQTIGRRSRVVPVPPTATEFGLDAVV
jgi:hypothetical protein